VKRVDRALGVVVRRHLDESKTTWLTRDAVGDERDVLDIAPIRAEQGPELLAITAVRKVTHVDLRRHSRFSSPAHRLLPRDQ
jgi:hypothetical protein